jgi:hypothetical protein
MKFRKKPYVVDAIKWSGNNRIEIEKFIKENFNRNFNVDDWTEKSLNINGLVLRLGDWIISSKGEFMICNGYVFEQTYEEYDLQNELNKELLSKNIRP